MTPFHPVHAAIAAVLIGSAARAADIRVPADHPDLQTAVAAAVDGDTILLADGSYAGPGFRNVDLAGKRITVRSESDDPERCRVSANGSSVFLAQTGEPRATRIRGLTLHASGHAIAIAGASPTIERCVFAENGGQVEGGGAAIRIFGGDPYVEACTFRSNVYYAQPGDAYVGGAVSVRDARATFVDCLFEDNRAVSLTDVSGGALGNRLGGHSLLVHCTLVGNEVETLGGGYLVDGGAIGSDPGGSATLVGCIVWNNDYVDIIGPVTASFCDVEGGLPGPGNLDVDPAFVAAGDYRLQPDSPLVDAGDPAALPAGTLLDLAGEPRVVNVRPDLGAYEQQAPDPTSYCEAGVNSTGGPARIAAGGSTSVAANDLVLSASGNPAGAVGLFFYGPSQVAVPFGAGTRCVGASPGGAFRLQPPQRADQAGDVARPVDLTQAPLPAGQIEPGSQWNFQWWYRDVGGVFNLSDGLAATFQR